MISLERRTLFYVVYVTSQAKIFGVFSHEFFVQFSIVVY